MTKIRFSRSTPTSIRLLFGFAVCGASLTFVVRGGLAKDWSYPAIALKSVVLLMILGLVVFPVVALLRGQGAQLTNETLLATARSARQGFNAAAYDTMVAPVRNVTRVGRRMVGPPPQ